MLQIFLLNGTNPCCNVEESERKVAMLLLARLLTSECHEMAIKAAIFLLESSAGFKQMLWLHNQ